MKYKKLITILIMVLVLLIPFQCVKVDKIIKTPLLKSTKTEITEFSNLYNLLLLNLIAPNHFKWENDKIGNWKNDWTHDAQAFAPEILFRAGYEELAKQTMDYNVDIGTVITNPVEFVVGFGSYYVGPEFYSDKMNWCGYMATGINIGTLLARQNPNPVGDITGYISGLSSVINTTFIDANTCLNPQLFVVGEKAMNEQIVGKLNLMQYWDSNRGYFYDPDPTHQGHIEFSSFQNGSATWALSLYYGITQNQDIRDKIETLYTNADSVLWHPICGGYRDAAGYLMGGAFDLGANLLWARGWLWTYWVTGDQKYLNKVKDTLTFIETYLLIDDSRHPGFKMLSHDYCIGGIPHPDYCTGCNFLALITIWHYNSLKQNGPLEGKIPISPNPSCTLLR